MTNSNTGDEAHSTSGPLPFTSCFLACAIGCVNVWWTAQKHVGHNKISNHRSESDKRSCLRQVRLHQTAHLAVTALYLGCATYSYWVTRGNAASLEQVLGIFAWFFALGSGFWVTVFTLVPNFEVYVLKYQAVIAVMTSSVEGIAMTISTISGVVAPFQNSDTIILTALDMLLSRQPASLGVTKCASAALGRLAGQQVQNGVTEPQQLISAAGEAIGAGVLVTVLQGLLFQVMVKGASSMLFISTLGIAQGYRLSMLLLHTRRVAQAAKGTLLGAAVAQSAVLQPLKAEPGLHVFRQPHATYILLSVYLLYIVISGVQALLEASAAEKPMWLCFMEQNSFLQPLSEYVSGLSTGKQQALVVVAVILALQVLSTLGLLASIPAYGLAAFLQAAPVVLLCVIMGFMMQACIVAYLAVTAPPGKGQLLDPHTDTPDATKRKSRSMEKARASADSSYEQAARIKKLGLNTFLETIPDRGFQQDSSQARLDALKNFQTAVSSLEAHGSTVGQDDFIRAARNVIRAVFPGILQSSISYVTSSYHAVDVFTVVGVGSNLPPRLNMPVAPGTLLMYVLDTGNPVFMGSTQDFVGPFSDVQFMAMALRLQSLAVVPLLYQGMEMVGVLQLGYEKAALWDEHDKALAHQLAIALAHGSTLIGNTHFGMGPQTPPQWSPMKSSGMGGGYNANYSIPASWYRPGAVAPHQMPGGLPLNASPGMWDTEDMANEGAPAVVPLPGLQEEVDASGLHLSGTLQDLKVLEIIGRGGFGSVYKGLWRSQVVAVKVLEHGDDFLGCSENPLDDSGENEEEDHNSRKAALLEGAVTSALDHPNVVKTFDYHVINVAQSNDKDGSVRRSMQQTQIVMEFCDRGCLQDAIDQGVFYSGGSRRPGGAAAAPDTTAAADVAVDMETLLMTLKEVAAALHYLHAHCITHRDLKPKNILLKSSTSDRRGFTAKVSDFGLSQVQQENERTHVSSKYSGTITHMPPELIEEGRVYPMGDVYAFGIIMWEIYTGGSPYSNMTRPQIMVGVVTHNLRPKFPESCPDWYKQLAYRCWRKDPRQRPSFSDVAVELQQLMDNLPA